MATSLMLMLSLPFPLVNPVQNKQHVPNEITKNDSIERAVDNCSIQ